MSPNVMGDSIQYDTNDLNTMRNTKTYKDSYELAEYIFRKSYGKSQRYNKIGEKLYKLCSEMRIKYELVFSNLGTRLNLTRDTLYEQSRDVMKEAFSDQECNFGRIVAIYAFCLAISEYCNTQSSLKEHVDYVFQATAEVMYSNQEWFQRNDSWVGDFELQNNTAIVFSFQTISEIGS